MELEALEVLAKTRMRSVRKIFYLSLLWTANVLGLIWFVIPENADENTKVVTAFVFILGVLLMMISLLGMAWIKYQVWDQKQGRSGI